MIAALMVYGALRVVSTRNVVHAALWLVVVLGGVAAQYILAAAEFVAVSQVMVYIGAVMVLFLFGIMLTRATIGAESDL
ncbi:MAG: NADH-quinone oxidoreductase subunit J, partial [Ilumatobacteraceae bacterium]